MSMSIWALGASTRTDISRKRFEVSRILLTGHQQDQMGCSASRPVFEPRLRKALEADEAAVAMRLAHGGEWLKQLRVRWTRHWDLHQRDSPRIRIRPVKPVPVRRQSEHAGLFPSPTKEKSDISERK